MFGVLVRSRYVDFWSSRKSGGRKLSHKFACFGTLAKFSYVLFAIKTTKKWTFFYSFFPTTCHFPGIVVCIGCCLTENLAILSVQTNSNSYVHFRWMHFFLSFSPFCGSTARKNPLWTRIKNSFTLKNWSIDRFISKCSHFAHSYLTSSHDSHTSARKADWEWASKLDAI